MFKKFSIIFATVVGVNSKPIARDDLPVFQNLHSLLSNTEKGMDMRIQNLLFIEEDLHSGMQTLQYLGKKDLVKNAKQGLPIADEAIDKVKSAVRYVSGLMTQLLMQRKRLEEVSAFLKKERVLLSKYAGQKLTDGVIDINRSANKMYGSMQKVKSMAQIVRERIIDIKDWMKLFDNLGNKVDQDHKMTWKIVLEDWQHTIKVARDGVKEIREELKATIAQFSTMKHTIEGLFAETQLNADKHMRRMKDEDVQLKADKIKKLMTTLLPHTKKIKTFDMDDMTSALLKGGFQKIEHVERFIAALDDAAGSYFSNGGPVFTKQDRRNHIKKLDELIAACDTMVIDATTNMEAFKAIILGGDSFKILQNLVISRGALNKNMNDTNVFLM